MEQNSAEIERFVQESQDGHFLQEDLSEIPNDQIGDLMSQGFDGGLPNVVSAFFGSKVSHNPSTNSSLGQTFSSRFQSAQGSKITFGNSELIGEGKSIKNYIDSTRDLASMQSAQLLNAHLRDQTKFLMTSKTGSKYTSNKGEKVVKGQKLSKRKKEYELAKAGIAGHLNLTKKLEPGQGGKLHKNLEAC